MATESNPTKTLRFREMSITPKIASEWLIHRQCGRPFRAYLAKQYAQEMKAGNWGVTHQGIAFNKKGELIDGQHRLSAIVSAGIPIISIVAYYNNNATALGLPIDTGGIRTVSDILEVNSRVLEPITFLFRELKPSPIMPGARRDREIATLLLKHPDLVPWITDTIPATCRRVVASASIRAAVVLAHTQGYDWVTQYDNLVNLRFEEMAIYPGLASLYRKLIQYEGSTAGREFRRVAFGAVYAAATSSKNIIQFRDTTIEDAWKSATIAFSKYIE